MRFALGLLLVAVFCVDAEGSGKRRREAYSRGSCQSVTYTTSNCSNGVCSVVEQAAVVVESQPVRQVEEKVVQSSDRKQFVPDALDEVNEYRAKRGLRAFIRDTLLTKAAYDCAKVRASNGIHGHLASDFDYLPAGAQATAAGCGALEPSWGWGTCCMDDNYTYAGAAWVMGNDGRRYMHLFVR